MILTTDYTDNTDAKQEFYYSSCPRFIIRAIRVSRSSLRYRDGHA
jgi:hypothetical protein